MKKNLIAILILLLFTTYSYPAGSGGGESGGSGSSGSSGSDLKPIIKSNFYQAVDTIKWAKKYVWYGYARFGFTRNRFHRFKLLQSKVR